MINMLFYENKRYAMNKIKCSYVGDILGPSCLVTNAAFKLKVVKCATESNF